MRPFFSYAGRWRETRTVGEDLERLKQRLPLLEYLQRHNWTARPAGTPEEFVGLCPLHRETRPSFYVNARKNLFYCHGCGSGGDLIRFIELSLDLPFRQSITHLERELAPASTSQLLEQTLAFYQLQLHRDSEGARYLEQRGLRHPTIEELGIGYAPGGNLHRHLATLGYSFHLLLEIGLINHHGRDAFCRRVIFPCRQHGQIVNLYGRSIGAAFPHRLLPRPKGGLFAWESVSRFSTVILVEGLFDLAVLWQAGFRHVTCSLGTHLNADQFQQLCDRPRTVYLTFDVDANGSGQQASQQLAQRLCAQGIVTRYVLLPDGHDPNSFFVQGGDARQFHSLLEATQP